MTVPASLEAGKSGDVTLKGKWPSNKTFTVSADKTVTMTCDIGDSQVLNVTFAGIELAGSNTVEVSETKQVSVDSMNALFGNWSGTFKYNLSNSLAESTAINNEDTSLASQVTMTLCSSAEWLDLCDATNGSNDLMHWENIATMVSHPRYSEPGDNSFHYHAFMGYSYDYLRAAQSLPTCGPQSDFGFRPSFVGKDKTAIDAQYNIGDVVVIGTLYMGDEPVKVPQNPVENGDITEYVDGTKLTLKKALDDEAYQLKAIYTGDGTFVADRVVLIEISFVDIEIDGILN